MKYIFHYAKHAKKDLASLDQSVSKRIALKLKYYSRHETPLQFSKALSGNLQGFFRFRIGSYRVIFEKDAQGRIMILTILRVKHRKEVYKII